MPDVLRSSSSYVHLSRPGTRPSARPASLRAGVIGISVAVLGLLAAIGCGVAEVVVADAAQAAAWSQLATLALGVGALGLVLVAFEGREGRWR